MDRDLAEKRATRIRRLITYRVNKQICKYIVDNESQPSQKGGTNIEC